MEQNIQNNQSGIPTKNYLVESILVTLFCCVPLGIVGIVNASKVEGLYRSGDIVGANNASATTKKWSLYGAIIGGIGAFLYIILFVIMGELVLQQMYKYRTIIKRGFHLKFCDGLGWNFVCG